MTEAEQTAKLLEIGARRFGLRIPCGHANATLCQHEVDEGRFAAYQCDDCGDMTDREVTSDDLDGIDGLPLLDVALWHAAICRECAPREMPALFFFQRAIKR